MISSLIVGTIFPKFALNPKLQISMPDGVPPAVAKAFSSLIPAIITLVIMCCGYTYVAKFTGMDAWTLVKTFISTPLSGLTQGIGMIIVCYFMIGLLWTFGLHGANIVGSITQPILTPLSLENVALFAAGKEPIWTVSGGEQAAFNFLGGSGATIGAIVAIFLFSKSKASRSIAVLATPPGIFEINEPLVFGLPIVMNVIYMFPFIFGPVILGIITYYLMELGMIRRCCISAPWVTPPILIGFLATGGDIRGAIWNVVAIGLLTVLWTPFIMMADKLEAGQE
jgi:PTS system cellobiose-specific IIC component